MRKRIISIFLAIVITIGLIPAFANTVNADGAEFGSYMATWTDGEGASYEKKFKSGDVITIPTNEFFEDTFRRSGYTLTGWQGYTEGMTMPLGDVIFTALYTPNQYTVTFDPNGGETIDPITVTYGEKYGRLPSSAITGLSGGDSNWYLVDRYGNVTDTNIKKLTKVTQVGNHTLFMKRSVLAPKVSIALTVPGGLLDGYQYYIPGASQRVLTATVGNMNTDILNYTYQWFKDGNPISDATSNVLTLDGNVSDSGTYKVEVTATLKDGTNILVTTNSATGSKEQKVKILHAANTLSYDANGGEGGPQSAYTGGATVPEHENREVPFEIRNKNNFSTKEKLAKKAAKLIGVGDVVFLDASSTVSHITEYLTAEQNLTVITNSTLVAEKLKEKHIRCYLTGGMPIENSYALVGSIAEQALSGVYANICFFSAQGIDEYGVISDQSEAETSLRKLMIKNSKKQYFLFDGSKYNKRFAFKICSSQDISNVITNLNDLSFKTDNK